MRSCIIPLTAACLATSLVMLAMREGHAEQNIAHWIEALGLSAQTSIEGRDGWQRPAMTQLGFKSGTALPDQSAVQELDALAAALASSKHHQYFFEIAWYVDPNLKPSIPGQALASRRASAVYEHLQSKPGVTPWRVMLRQARKRPDASPTAADPNSLLIIVSNLGL